MTVEVVHLMIDEACPNLLALDHNRVSVEVDALCTRERRALAWVPQAGHGEAAFVAELLQLLGPLGDDGIEDVADVALDVPRERAKAYADLVCREAGTAIVIDGLDEVGHELAHGLVNGLDGRARRAQHGVANGSDSAEGHGDILSRRGAAPEYSRYMEVVSERLVLRPFAASDVDDVHVYASDPAVCFFTDWGPNSREETESFVADAVASGAPLNVAITLAQDLLGASGTVSAGTVIGGLSAFGAHRAPISDHPAARELGWVVRRDLWGQRIATEAVGAFVSWLHAQHAVTEFTARCRPQNRSSSRVMEHIGMSYVQRIPDDVTVKGEPADSEIYRLVITP